MRLTHFKDFDKKIFPELQEFNIPDIKKVVPKKENEVKEKINKLIPAKSEELNFKKYLTVLKEFDPEPIQTFEDKTIWSITFKSITIRIKFINDSKLIHVWLSDFERNPVLIAKNVKELNTAINCWLRNR